MNEEQDIKTEKKVGNFLKEKREKLGYTLSEVSEKTCVKQKFLEAVEANDWEVMGGVGYTKALLSTYARALKLEPQEIIELFEKEVNKPEKNAPRFTKYKDIKPKKMLIPLNFFSILILIILIIVLSVVTVRLYKEGKLGSPFSSSETPTEKKIEPKIQEKNGEDKTFSDTTDYIDELEFQGAENPLNYQE
ncbi:MAG: helix-turn-helix domain-containing protein [Candidatus Cloacimonadota bacterium]|nr:helix-turn-helix domain-containing protein [Candidatus Cloacimonadota bacterium]